MKNDEVLSHLKIENDENPFTTYQPIHRSGGGFYIFPRAVTKEATLYCLKNHSLWFLLDVTRVRYLVLTLIITSAVIGLLLGIWGTQSMYSLEIL